MIKVKEGTLLGKSDPVFFSFFFFKIYLYTFSERGRREKGREGNISVTESVASHTPSTRDPAHNTGLCPDRESNRRPFGLQAGAQSAEPHQPGLTQFSHPWMMV